MNNLMAAYRRLPARNKKRVKVYIGGLVAAVLVAWWMYSPGPDSAKSGSSDVPISAKSRAAGAAAPDRGRGDIVVTQEYLEKKKEAELRRRAEARRKHESYIPSVRDSVGNIPEDSEASLLDKPQPEQFGPTPPDQVVAGIPKDIQCRPDGASDVGMRLASGECIMPNGDVYDKDGKLKTKRSGANGDGRGGQYNGTHRKDPEQIARERQVFLNSFLGTVDKIDKEYDDRMKVKVLKFRKNDTRNVTRKKNGPDRSGGQANPETGTKEGGTKPGPDSGTPFRGFKPGNMLIGILDTKIDSDAPSQIRVTIPTGALRGARLVGSISQKEEYIVAKMNYLTFKDRYAKINAVLVDPATRITALQGNVDRHTFSRLGAAFLYGISTGARELVLQRGNTTITSGSTTVARPDPGTSEILKAGAGKAAEILTDPLKKLINRKPTVTIPQNAMVGIMFVEPVPINWLPDRAIKEADRL